MKFPLVLGVSVCLSLAACGDSETPATQDSSVVDVPTAQDTGVDAAADVRANDVAVIDVAADASADVAADRTVVADAGVDAVADVAADTVVVADAAADNGATVDVPAGRACGGRGGSPCPTGQVCDFPTSSICGRADGPGVCTTPPEVCSDLFDPVCGCDGRTYSNACEAATASVSVDFRGVCASKDAGAADVTTSDCRTSGCSTTSTCMACRGVGGIVYACIPRGAAC